MENKDFDIVDWAEGLPLGVLSLIASLGGSAMHPMREVCKFWKLGFEQGIVHINTQGSALPPSGFSERFPMLCQLDHEFRLPQAGASDAPPPEGDDYNNSSLEALRGVRLTSLRWAGFGQLSDGDLRILRGMPLKRLALPRSELLKGNITTGGGGFRAVRGAPLTDLDLSGCTQICDSALIEFQGFSLTALNLSACYQISSTGLAPVWGLPLLRLDLGATTVTDADLVRQLPKLPGLTALGLSECVRVGGPGLAALRTAPRLAALCLRGCSHLATAELRQLAGLTLTELDLLGCAQLENETLEEFAGMPLQILALGGCRRLWNLQSLSLFPALTSLDLSNCVNPYYAQFGSSSLLALSLRDCELQAFVLGRLSGARLTSLDLGWCKEPGVTNEGMFYLSGLPLTRLNLEGAKRVTDRGLWPLIGMPLANLSLGFCSGLTNGCIEVLLGLSLSRLSLKYCPWLEPPGLAALHSAGIRPDTAGCSGLAEGGAGSLEEQFRI